MEKAGTKSWAISMRFFAFLSDAQHHPESSNAGGYEQPVHQLPVAHSPACQCESGADEKVHKKEEDQKEIKISVHVFRLLQRQDDPVCPGIAGDQEDDHE